MNIFYLDKNPSTCAQYHCDKHVVKMVLETAQLLCTAHRVLDGDNDDFTNKLYKKTHVNHPCALWVRQSSNHYQWLYELFKELSNEYTKRYGKTHLSWQKFKDLLKVTPKNIKNQEFVDPPQCMPDQYKCDNTVKAYKNYYIGEKVYFAKWNKLNNIPEWWPNEKNK